MSNFFGGLTGIQFPDVVMNQGPLPPQSGSLPAPLHSTPDAKINYNSTLLGDLQPYAYAEPQYLSSQNGYQNIPHRIQKIIPVIHIPEPHGQTLFRLSHPVDDGDVAFSISLDKKSIFCNGARAVSKSNALGTAIDPFINLPTLNYILAHLQLAFADEHLQDKKLWYAFLHALDTNHFPEHNTQARNYKTDVFDLDDIVYIIENCIRPFGIFRGSEKQGGQNEETMSPATWPVPFVGTLVVDGREEHIVNMWHEHNVHAGADLVLRLKPMPIPTRYTLNHYYKQCIYKDSPIDKNHNVVWQLVPDTMYNNTKEDMREYLADSDQYKMPDQFKLKRYSYNIPRKDKPIHRYIWYSPIFQHIWPELGYWHIGRSQVRITRFVTSHTAYYYDDTTNGLRSQYMLMTFQPTFYTAPHGIRSAVTPGWTVVDGDNKTEEQTHSTSAANSQAGDGVASRFMNSLLETNHKKRAFIESDSTLQLRPKKTHEWAIIAYNEETPMPDTSHAFMPPATESITVPTTASNPSNTSAITMVPTTTVKKQRKNTSNSGIIIQMDGSVKSTTAHAMTD
jgi:hypothetical protein